MLYTPREVHDTPGLLGSILSALRSEKITYCQGLEAFSTSWFCGWHVVLPAPTKVLYGGLER